MIAQYGRLRFQLLEPVFDNVADRDDADEAPIVLHHQVALTLTGHPTHCVFEGFISLADGGGPHDLPDRQLMDRSLMLVHGPDYVTLGDEPNHRAFGSDDRKATNIVLDQESNRALQGCLRVQGYQRRGLTP